MVPYDKRMSIGEVFSVLRGAKGRVGGSLSKRMGGVL